MTRRMLIVKPDGATSDYAEVLAPNEKHLQDLVKNHAELLPLDDRGPGPARPERIAGFSPDGAF